jgi:hypothetical protein
VLNILARRRDADEGTARRARVPSMGCGDDRSSTAGTGPCSALIPGSAPALIDTEPFLSVLNPYLLQLEIGAAILLGIGIIFESDRYPEIVRQRAFWFVMWGMIFETIFSIGLFASEERIASLQRTTIISLGKQVGPRILDTESEQRIVPKLKPFGLQSYDLSVPVTLEPGAALITQILGMLSKQLG